MTWNYRVVRSMAKTGEAWLSIRTDWYDEDKSSTPHSIGDTPMYPVGEDIEELGSDMKSMYLALAKTILNEEDFTKKVQTIQDHS